jgi:hypothetical protein
MIRIEHGFVIKTYPTAAQEEFEKAQALWALSAAGAFHTPRPLSLDAKSQQLTFEYLRGLRPITMDYVAFLREQSSESIVLERFRLVGCALAAIHNDLAMTHTLKWTPQAPFITELRRNHVLPVLQEGEFRPVLHCDYGFSNIFFTSHSEVPVILDASPNGYTTFSTACRGPAYIDVAHFLACIYCLWWKAKTRRPGVTQLDRLANAYVTGYQEGSGQVLSHRLLTGTSRAIGRSYLKSRFRGSLLPWVADKALYSRTRHCR